MPSKIKIAGGATILFLVIGLILLSVNVSTTSASASSIKSATIAFLVMGGILGVGTIIALQLKASGLLELGPYVPKK